MPRKRRRYISILSLLSLVPSLLPEPELRICRNSFKLKLKLKRIVMAVTCYSFGRVIRNVEIVDLNCQKCISKVTSLWDHYLRVVSKFLRICKYNFFGTFVGQVMPPNHFDQIVQGQKSLGSLFEGVL